MSKPLAMIATITVALIAGRLTAWLTVTRLRTRLAQANDELRHDPLTGLLNRTGLTEAYAEPRPHPTGSTLVLIDLDQFETINNTHGHDAGDQLLVTLAERIHQVATVYGGVAARLSGDEFTVLLPSHHDDTGRTVERILSLIATPATVDLDDATVSVTFTASVGTCRAETTDDLKAVLRRADIAMYHAKHAGGGGHIAYQPGMAMPNPRPRKGPRLRDRRHPGLVDQ